MVIQVKKEEVEEFIDKKFTELRYCGNFVHVMAIILDCLFMCRVIDGAEFDAYHERLRGVAYGNLDS